MSGAMSFGESRVSLKLNTALYDIIGATALPSPPRPPQ